MLVARLIYSFIIAAGVGYFTAKSQLANVAANYAPHYGPWVTLQWLAGEQLQSPSPALAPPSVLARLYLRAKRAQGLPVTNEEIVTFSAATDSEGAPLLRSCSYRFDGPAMAAQWWSAHVVIGGPRKGPVLDPARTSARPGAAFHFKIGASLDTDAAQTPFKIVFRLYRPEESLMTPMSASALPGIIVEGCT